MYRILIAEDEEFLVQALRDNLEADGYEVDIAANGVEAIARVLEHRPDLILLDLLMPKRDGMSVLKELRENAEWKHIPVIVLSNFGGDVEIKRALQMGANDYFVKSQHMVTEVIDKIKNYLEPLNRRI